MAPPPKHTHPDLGKTLTRIEQDIARISDAVYGNGKPGLATRLALLEERQGNAWSRTVIIASVVVALAIIGRLDSSLIHLLTP